jgi:hypothetical protein
MGAAKISSRCRCLQRFDNLSGLKKIGFMGGRVQEKSLLIDIFFRNYIHGTNLSTNTTDRILKIGDKISALRF